MSNVLIQFSVLLAVLAGSCASTVAQDPQPAKRVRVSQGVAQAFLVKKVPPEYPAEARKKHIEGTVKLKTEISIDGDVADLSVIDGDPVLATAAIAAVKQWKYKPYLLNGEPVAIETQVTVVFQLKSN